MTVAMGAFSGADVRVYRLWKALTFQGAAMKTKY
jgi:hypothetical protein